jgi:hypothetical protein
LLSGSREVAAFPDEWKITEVNGPATLELQANGPDDVTLKLPDDGLLCEAKFDGKD